MAKLKKVGVISSALLSGGVMTCAGLTAGIIYSFGGAFIDALVSMGLVVTDETPGLSYGTVLAFYALIAMPIIFAVPGFIAGALGAFFYNLVAGRIGGLDMDFEQEAS